MSGNKGRGQAITGQQTCRCDCRQCRFGYHCSPCAEAHRAAVDRRGHTTGRRNREAPPTPATAGSISEQESTNAQMRIHMALMVRLYVNLKEIGWLEMRRLEHYDGVPPADSMNTYEVRRGTIGRPGTGELELIGRVKHRYGNGAYSLAMKGCMLTDAVDRERR